MFGVNYDGLREKKTYDELIDYVMNKPVTIQYPDRTADFLRNSPQLSNLLDGEGEGLLEMEEQQKRQMEEQQKEHIIREMAGHKAGSTAEIRAAAKARLQQRYPSGGINTARPNRPEVFDLTVGDNMDVDDDNELKTDVTVAINKQEENVTNKKSKIAKNAAQNLGNVVPQSTPLLFPSSSSSASTVAPSSSPAGAASSSSAGGASSSSSSSAVQNMIVIGPMGLNEIMTMIQVRPESRKEKAEIQVLPKKKNTACSD